jgi:hypothetical protein
MRRCNLVPDLSAYVQHHAPDHGSSIRKRVTTMENLRHPPQHDRVCIHAREGRDVRMKSTRHLLPRLDHGTVTRRLRRRLARRAMDTSHGRREAGKTFTRSWIYRLS